MTPARIALALLFSCSLALAQDRPSSAATLPGNGDAGKKAVATAPEPWRLRSSAPAAASVEKNPLDRLQIDLFKIDPDGRPFKLEAKTDSSGLGPESLLNGQLPDDTTCYAIRSYVVARDSKNSDSTHPVSYSTCQPASRYRLKTADAKAKESDH